MSSRTALTPLPGFISPDIHARDGVQGGHPAGGLGENRDTHGSGQGGEADLFTILIRQICQSHPACNCQNPTLNRTQFKSHPQQGIEHLGKLVP